MNWYCILGYKYALCKSGRIDSAFKIGECGVECVSVFGELPDACIDGNIHSCGRSTFKWEDTGESCTGEEEFEGETVEEITQVVTEEIEPTQTLFRGTIGYILSVISMLAGMFLIKQDS